VQPEWVFSFSARAESWLSTSRKVLLRMSGMGREGEEEESEGGRDVVGPVEEGSGVEEGLRRFWRKYCRLVEEEEGDRDGRGERGRERLGRRFNWRATEAGEKDD
jgi:hypothetical protein